jgi:hypothetical protein
MDTYHRKRMSRDRYPLLCDVHRAQQSVRGHKENTAPVLLAACVLRALPSSGSIRHNINNLIHIKVIKDTKSIHPNLDGYAKLSLMQWEPVALSRDVKQPEREANH